MLHLPSDCWVDVSLAGSMQAREEETAKILSRNWLCLHTRQEPGILILKS